MNRQVLAKVKELNIENLHEIKDISIRWKFDKETGKLDIQIIKTPNMTMGKTHVKITEATRDYGKWMV